MFDTMAINMYSIKVSKTLDGLFDSASYDKRFRPDFGKQPTNVEVMLGIVGTVVSILVQ